MRWHRIFHARVIEVVLCFSRFTWLIPACPVWFVRRMRRGDSVKTIPRTHACKQNAEIADPPSQPSCLKTPCSLQLWDISSQSIANASSAKKDPDAVSRSECKQDEPAQMSPESTRVKVKRLHGTVAGPLDSQTQRSPSTLCCKSILYACFMRMVAVE